VAARPDPELQRQLEELARTVRGRVGIYVRHLRSGRTAAVNADEAFPTASMVKVPILIGTFDAVERGRLSFNQPLVYTDSLLYEGHDIIGALQDSAAIPLAQVALLMITTSDNTGSLWLQGLVGGAAINDWLAAHGFDSTRVNSRVPGREEARSRYGWGQTTPREIAELLVTIREGRAVSRAASEEMYRHLTRIYWTGEALSQIPPWVQAASKQGAVDRSKSEVVLVNAPSGDYVFAVITREQQDERWEDDNEGYVLIRAVSALLWRTFEPAHPWAPAPGVERFKPEEED
jgi:beta-lactamase class A